jgi:methionyl-tRNA synthetase
MFLPDRYIKGECPKCGAKDQYGDSCEVCGAVYAPTELKHPYSALTGATPELRSSAHHFFLLSSQRCLDFLQEWTATPGRLQPEVLNKIREWFAPDDAGHVSLSDWDISRDAPYFGIRIPDTEDKYFYVWLDAPVGYLASLKGHFAKLGLRLRSLCGRPAGRADPLHRQGHRLLPHPVLAGDAAFQRPQDADHVFVHGFLQLSGEKMSKSRGTGLSPCATSNSA